MYKKIIAGVICASMALTTATAAVSHETAISASAASSAYATGSYRVSISIGVNVRSGPSTGYGIKGASANGTRFTVSKVSGSWGYTDSIYVPSGKYISGWICLDNCTFQGGSGSSVSVSQPAAVSSVGNLDLNAADAYAKKYWKNYNTAEYRSYKSSIADCMNFCSQILHAAGLPETSKWHGSYTYSTSDITDSFKHIPDFIAYVRSEYGIKYYNNVGALSDKYKDGSSFSISDIKHGDMITRTTNGIYGRDHIMYVLGTSGNDVLYAAHTTDDCYGLSSGGKINIKDVKGLLKTSDLFTNQSPAANQNPSADQSPSKIIYGDVNNSGTVTMSDLIALNQYLANPREYPLKNSAAADVNGDMKVTSEDADIINRYLVGLISSLPYHEPSRRSEDASKSSTVSSQKSTSQNVLIRSAYYSGYIADVYAGWTNKETPVTLYPINNGTGSDNQIFKQTYLSDGYFRLDPTHTTGMSLDLHGTTGMAQIYPTHNGSNQKFKTVSTGDSDGSVYIVSESGLYLTYNSSAKIYGSSSPSKLSKWYIY